MRKASSCVADRKSKTTCFIYFIGSVVKIVLYLDFLCTKDGRLHQIKEKHEWWKNCLSDTFTYGLHLKSFPTLFLLIQGNFMFSRSYKIVFYALFLHGHYFVEYGLMLVCIFYNFFLKTSFSTFSTFCVFCFESNVLNQDIKICVILSFKKV